jgi:single-stranded-DNA-specific exonuclease
VTKWVDREDKRLKKSWEFQNYDETIAKKFHQQLGISMLAARLLAQRGIRDLEEAKDFLYADLNKLTDPWSIGGVTAAVKRIKKAIEVQEKVVIYGDYDVDGVCSIVILKECLESQGCLVDYYVPNRFKEGYGLNKEAVESLAGHYQLMITVDCGINSVEEIELAISLGMDVIITDHHTPPPVQAPAVAVINPKNDSIKSIINLAGVGVAFKLACALLEDQLPQEYVFKWLDLVALATIADIVPLMGENRILVKYGLRVLQNTQRLGLRALIRETGLEGKAIQSWQVGYLLAPRLNSAGRLESAQASIELLASHDEEQASAQAARLCQLNNERRLIEEGIYQEAIEKINGYPDLTEEMIIVVGGQDWHRGVIGIVASRLAEQYNRPTIVISWEGNIGRASARSIGIFDIYEAISSAQAHLLQFGGHRMAAGLSIMQDQLSNFKAALKQYGVENLLEFERNKVFQVDMEIEEEDIKQELIDEMELLHPFGEGNPVPRFALRASTINSPAWVGKNQEHLKFRIGSKNIEAIAFNRRDRTEYPLQNCNHDLLFELDTNEFRGKRSLQMKVKDFKSTFISDQIIGKEETNSVRLALAISRAVEELREKRPVLFIYPSFRSLQKHQAVLEYFFNKSNVQAVHAHLGLGARKRAQEELAQGQGRVFISTRSFIQYHQDKHDLPANLRYIVRMWPLAKAEQDALDFGNRELETIRQADHLIFYRTREFSGDGQVLLYANLGTTVQRLKNNYSGLNIEAGLTDMSQRRAVRRDFIAAMSGALLSDGTHTAGHYISKVGEFILVDSPLGRFELASITDYLNPKQEIKIAVGFDKTSFERNHDFLNRLYPSLGTIEEVLLYCLRFKPSRSGTSMDTLLASIDLHFNKVYSRMEILAVLRILADLGLCRFEKSGSIIAINFVNAKNSLEGVCNTPYYLEGLAEKQVFADWEMELNKELVW